VFIVTVAVSVGLVLRSRRVPHWVGLVSVAAFALPGIVSIRGMYWWGMAAPVLLAETVDFREPARDRDPANLANTAVVAALGVALLAALGRWVPYRGAEPPPEGMLSYAPQALTRELGSVLRPGEPFFNAQLWGSWFEYALPSHPVVADSRIEVIPESAWDDYLAVSDAREGWPEILEGWGIRVLALRNDQQGPLIAELTGHPGWTLVAEDEDGSVFVREPG
jgi:hypothetical protein